MVVEKSYWVTFLDKETAEYIDREVRKVAIDLGLDIQVFRGWLFKAFAYDPEVRAKIIEYIKKNGSRTN